MSCFSHDIKSINLVKNTINLHHICAFSFPETRYCLFNVLVSLIHQVHTLED